MMKRRPFLSIMGLGKLGSPMAACFAARGFHVVGVDADVSKVDAISKLRAPVLEPGLPEILQLAKGRLSATGDVKAAVHGTDVTMIVVPTPSDEAGGFSLRFVRDACRAIGMALAEKKAFHVVVLTSTVMPGATGGEVQEVVEAESGKRAGVDFGLCYSPEFIALGTVIRDLLNPSFVLIGESDSRTGDFLESVYRRFCDNDPPVARMNLINAEIAKLSVNTYVTTKIAFANMLARVCEKLPGADVDVVTSAIGLDQRIGSAYLKGAISYGGPCFPRDNRALALLTREIDAPSFLPDATDRSNRSDIRALVKRVLDHLPDGGRVAVLGLAYKPHTDVVEEAPGLLLAKTLTADGVPVSAYDPVANANAADAVGAAVNLSESVEACIDNADVVVVATPWPEFRDIAMLIERDGDPRTIIDCWRMLDREAVSAVGRYVALGEGPNPDRELASLA
jgi:UDPglucose 6-dehydrogenase